MNTYEISSTVSNYQVLALQKHITDTATLYKAGIVKLFVNTLESDDFEYTGLAGAMCFIKN